MKRLNKTRMMLVLVLCLTAALIPLTVAPAAAENGKIVRTVYCTFLTATELTATEWTAVNSSFEWEKNDEGRDGWRSFGTIDTSATRRFWRLVVTLDPLTAGETVSFGSQATGN